MWMGCLHVVLPSGASILGGQHLHRQRALPLPRSAVQASFLGIFLCLCDFPGLRRANVQGYRILRAREDDPLPNGRVDLWAMTLALGTARKCSVWTGGSILSSAPTFQWSSTHDHDESGPQCGGLRSVTQTGICATVWLVFLSFSFSSRHLDSPNAAGPWPMRQMSARRSLRSDAFGMSLILLPFFLLFCALFPFSRFDALEIKCCFSTP